MEARDVRAARRGEGLQERRQICLRKEKRSACLQSPGRGCLSEAERDEADVSTCPNTGNHFL